MSINLTKGQKINLVKENGTGLTELMVGLGWDPVKRTGFGLFSSHENIDCDASVLVGNERGLMNREPVIYFGHLNGYNGAIQHKGDNLTGDGDGDDEQIYIDLARLPEEVTKLMLVVNIYSARARKQDFGMIENAFVRVVDNLTGKEFCRYNLSNGAYNGKTALIVGEIYKHNGVWKFNAVGNGTTDGSISELKERFGNLS